MLLALEILKCGRPSLCVLYIESWWKSQRCVPYLVDLCAVSPQAEENVRPGRTMRGQKRMN